MVGVTYDTGALIAADRGQRRMWALHAGFLALECTPTVPAPVLAQAWRGGARQALLARMLTACSVEALTEQQAWAVGVLANASGHHDVVDLAVTEGALRRGDLVVTADHGDIQAIADAVNREVVIEPV